MSGQPTANELFHEVQRLIRLGQPVFPCQSVGSKAKTPLIQRGLNAATLDVDQARAWWRQHRNAAIGIPTGIIWDVLDVDTKDGRDGRKHLAELQRLGLLNGCQKVARTPSSGLHFYFPATPGLTNKASATLGLDVRAKGGYVLAPPSYLTDAETATGDVYSGAYRDMGEITGNDDSPLMWSLISSCLAPVNTETNKPIMLLPSERRASISALREWVTTLNPGERNNGFHWAVCRCIDNGIDPNELIEPALLIGLSEDEIGKTIGSALKRAGVLVEELDSEVEAMFPTES